MFWILCSLREEIFSRLLSEVLASVQDSVQKEMGLGLEGLRQQLKDMITASVVNTSQQSPTTAHTRVGGKYEFDWVLGVTCMLTSSPIVLQNVKQ